MLWADNPELQRRYEAILAETRRLQQQLGVEPQTLEQRHQNYLIKKQQQEQQLRQLKELERLRAQMPALRPSIRRPR